MTNLSGANFNNGAAVGPQGEGRERPSTLSEYSAYKDSGVEWLGDVPDGWSVASLRFFADLITGITPPSDDLSNYAEEGWSWVRPEDLDDSGRPVLASKFLTDQGWAFCRKVKGQSTLICCIGTIGKLGFIETDACTNQQITAVVPRQSGRFYFYAMHALKLAFDAYATGNVLRILNSERLGSVEIAVPSKNEAESIARFLDHETARIDALIEEQQRLIELLKEKRQAVISHAVTKGLDPTVPMKDSGVEWLCEVPVHWRVGNIKYFLEAIGDVDHYMPQSIDKGIPYVMTGDLMERVSDIQFEECKQVAYDDYLKLSGRIKTSKGDVVMARYATIGSVSYVDIDAEFLVSYSCVTIKPDLSKVLGIYLFYYFKSDSFLNGIRAQTNTNTQDNVGVGDIKNLKIALPPAAEQMKIVDYLQSELGRLDAISEVSLSTISLAREKRSALISAAVTGKIDVRGWQPPASAPTPELVQEAV